MPQNYKKGINNCKNKRGFLDDLLLRSPPMNNKLNSSKYLMYNLFGCFKTAVNMLSRYINSIFVQ